MQELYEDERSMLVCKEEEEGGQHRVNSSNKGSNQKLLTGSELTNEFLTQSYKALFVIF